MRVYTLRKFNFKRRLRLLTKILQLFKLKAFAFQKNKRFLD